MTKNVLWFVLIFCVLQAVSKRNLNAADRPLSLLNFSLSERVLKQKNETYNLSTMPTWNPSYELSKVVHLESNFGFTVMSSTDGSVWTSRFQVGASFHNLIPTYFDNKDRIVPEVLIGAETWSGVPKGGVYFAPSLNIHYRFLNENKGALDHLDSIFLGYTPLMANPLGAQILVLGFRFNFSPSSEEMRSTPVEPKQADQRQKDEFFDEWKRVDWSVPYCFDLGTEARKL